MQPFYPNREFKFLKEVFIDLERPFKPKRLIDMEFEEKIKEVA
tara:strand:+ start:168 stop:296 length:129 start_codon:yes stop_codon:yes gene_type:complete